MTDESKSLTEPWVAKHKATYAYAYDKGGKLQRFFGVRGIPHAILVDPSGRVAWRGHPASLTSSEVEKHLTGALLRPLYTWSSAAKAVASELKKGNFAKALDKAGSLKEEDGGPEIAKQVQGLIASRLKALQASHELGDYLGALEEGEKLAKGLSGLPEEEQARKVVASIEANERAKPVIEAQKTIRKLREKSPTKRRDVEKAIDELRDISRSLPDTYAATEANAYLELLFELMRR